MGLRNLRNKISKSAHLPRPHLPTHHQSQCKSAQSSHVPQQQPTTCLCNGRVQSRYKVSFSYLYLSSGTGRNWSGLTFRFATFLSLPIPATCTSTNVVHHNFQTVKTSNKMTRLLIVILTTVLFYSCGQDRPKINHEAVDTTSVVDDTIKDTTKILVSELPVKFDSTDILLFAIGLVDLQERGGYSKVGSGSYSSSDIAAAYFNSDNLIGNFINIVFHDKNGNEKKLTDKKIKIRSVNFLRDVFRSTKTGYLIYSISDRDSNGDKELDHSDLEALYISKLDGSNFKKLTKELH